MHIICNEYGFFLTQGNRVISSSILQSVNQFFSWWGAELASLVPQFNFKSNIDGKNSISININKDSFFINNNRNQSLLDASSKLSMEHVNEIKTLLDKEYSESGKVSLRINIDENIVLTRVITLPANTEENLYEVIQYEMDRYTPFSADEIYFDYKLEERIPEKNIIRVRLIVVKKEILDPVYKIIESSGLVLESIDVVNQETSDIRIHDVQFLRVLVGKRYNQKSSIKNLSFIAAGLLVLVAITPLVFNHIKIYQLSKELKKLEPTVVEVRKLQDEYQEVLDNVGYLMKIKEKNSSTIELLNLLTQVLPDHTHVQRMSLEGGVLSLQGLSASASELIPVIDEVGLFEDIRFAAPVTQSRTDNSERFSITAKLSAHQINRYAKE